MQEDGNLDFLTSDFHIFPSSPFRNQSNCRVFWSTSFLFHYLFLAGLLLRRGLCFTTFPTPPCPFLSVTQDEHPKFCCQVLSNPPSKKLLFKPLQIPPPPLLQPSTHTHHQNCWVGNKTAIPTRNSVEFSTHKVRNRPHLSTFFGGGGGERKSSILCKFCFSLSLFRKGLFPKSQKRLFIPSSSFAGLDRGKKGGGED